MKRVSLIPTNGQIYFPFEKAEILASLCVVFAGGQERALSVWRELMRANGRTKEMAGIC